MNISENTGEIPIGVEAIRHFLRLLPGTPGVYRMMNQAGDVLYVGKARDLKRRVSSYTRLQGQSERIAKMICETATMEFVTTNTEMEALLLEANLIKRLRPRYNVLMRDSKSFPHILLTNDHPAARLVKHRGARTTPGTYYGPFASPWAVNRTITALQKAFLLRSCTDSVYESRTRPCLLYQIKRCSGPCTGEISLADYKALVNEAHAFLSGRSRAVKEQLAAAMEQASEQLEFEDAAKYRDRLAALAMVQQHQGINPQTVDEADVFAVHQEGGKTCIQVFFFRTGQNWGNRAYFPQASWELGPGEVLNAFLGQFYDDQQVPRLVLLSHEVPEQAMWQKALALRAGHTIEISVPKRGEKRHLVEQAERNAREALGRKLAETSSQARLLDELAKTFGLPDTPRRIEIYDNSHISGTNAVGAMVVAGAEGFIKNQYRKFNIRSTDITPGDDFGMMREVLLRRFSRLQREETARDADAPGEDVPAWPDVVLIDGGQGQLSAAEAILADLGLTDVVLIGVAKGRDRDAGRETFFMSGHAPFRLEPRDPVLYFLQRLRDEAHRFAIGAHRTKRAAGISKNPLDDIPGIGPHRKRALMRHFGSAKAVAGAGVADLHAVTGINQQMAQLIYDFFHEKRE